MKKLSIYIVLSSLLLIGSTALATTADVKPTTQVVVNQPHYQHVVWNGIPISLVLPVGEERIVKFPEPVTLSNNNPNLTTHKIQIMNNDGMLYVTAKKAFSPIRTEIRLRNGTLILLDLSANAGANDLPVSITQQIKQSGSEGHNQKHTSGALVTSYITMLRYGIQHLYAPERLVKDNPEIYRATMDTSRSVRLFPESNLLAMPAMWG